MRIGRLITLAVLLAMTACGSEDPPTTAKPHSVLKAIDSTDRPPAARLATSTESVEGELGTNCWEVNAGSNVCSDSPAITPTTVMPVRKGTALTLSFDRKDAPDVLRVYASTGEEDEGSVEIGQPGTNPATFDASLDPGIYIVSVSSFWKQGDASHFFRIRVS